MPRSDFNGDGRSDILWRLGTFDAVSNWLGTPTGGFQINDANAFTYGVPFGYLLIGTGDFNGDGFGDVLARYRWSPSDVKIWHGSSTGGLTAGLLSFVGRSAQVIGIGDLNDDGRDDLLVGGSTNFTIFTAAMDARFSASSVSVTHPADWQVAGVGDFNGDGRDDILWRNQSGTVSNWLNLVGGLQVNDANAMVQAPTDWHIVGVGDFNGDGRDDIVWRNDSGSVSNWLAEADGGFAINDAIAFARVSTAWEVTQIGDYNGDGRDDLLWRNTTTGDLSNWLGSASGGWLINDANAYWHVPLEWHVQPINGTAILWGLLEP